MDICIRGDDSPPLLRYISAFTKPPSCCCRGTESASTDAKTFRFVLSVSSIPFFSFAVYSIWVCIYIYMKLCAWPRLLAARVKREIFIWIQPAVRAACFLRFAAGSLLLRHAEENDLASLTSVSSATVTTNSNKNCVKFIPLIIHFILRRNDTK